MSEDIKFFWGFLEDVSGGNKDFSIKLLFHSIFDEKKGDGDFSRKERKYNDVSLIVF